MIWQLPILQVVIPLLAAPLCALLPASRPRWCWWLSASVAGVCLMIAAQLWSQVVLGDVHSITYAIGGWSPPWGIEYRIDRLNALVLLLVSGVATLVLAGARDSIEAEIPADRVPYFYACILLCITGLLGMTATGDAFNIFVFLEISALSSYALIAMGRDRRALAASFQYLVMGTIGATFILIGIGFLYMVTGTLNLDDLGHRIPAMTESRTVHAAFAFLTVGLALKIALFPLHLWLPNAYAFAPSIVSALLAATATKVSLYVLMRFIYTVFGAEYAFATLGLHEILAPLSVVAIFVASVVAIFQDDVKRLLAYSSVAQIGYMTLGISIATQEGTSAAIVHLFNHGLMKATLFMALAAVMLRIGSTRLADLRGLFRRMPWTSTWLALGALSLAGVPLTAGFVSKWAVLSAALHRDAWLLAVMVVISSLIALLYVWRILEAIFLRRPPADCPPVSEPPMRMLVPLAVLALTNIVLGLHTELNLHGAVWAAEELMRP